MKYIRTKDGIWKYVGKRELALTPKSKLVDYYVNKRLHCFVSYGYGRLKEERIIAKADTIEELCDEFLVFDDRKPFNEHYPFLNKNCPTGFIHAQDMVKACKNEHFVVYGAIWNDKGLIYVAKMNDKGELELL